MYHDGKGVPLDLAQAFLWSRKSAEQGDAKGESALAYAYYNGQGVPQDYAEASGWYRKAAEQGDPLAQQGLAYMYAKGDGVPHDDAQAVTWYRRAAEQGDAEAQQSLGYMYANGRGVTEDRTEARRWYRKAAEQGNAKAQHALERLGEVARPPVRTRYIELGSAVIASLAGVLFLLDFTWGKIARGWRRASMGILGLVLLGNAGLSLYAFSHDVRFSPYHDLFHLTRKVLVSIAILIVVFVILPAKKKPNAFPE
jgi:hypothetical protein